MALQDLLDLSKKHEKIELSEERVEAALPIIRQYVAYWREYPDMFVDYLLTMGNPKDFNFFFYQRVFLRAGMRHKYVYCTFPRAFSKSFLSMMILMIRCVLYPDAHLFVTSGGKEQAAGIMEEKVREICDLIPAFEKEIDWNRGVTREGKDYARYTFKNKSYFDNIAARETSRGKRRHAGVIEECVSVDGEILQTVIVPTMNVSRKCANGEKSPASEQLNKSQLYITTAGFKKSFPYDKLIQLLVWQIVKPETSIIMGGTYRVPVLVGLLDKGFVTDLKQDSTFNEISFGREYVSRWAGASADAFFNSDIIDKNRVLRQPEYEFSERSKNYYYVIAADIGRKGCQSCACVIKVTPGTQGYSLKQLVNIVTVEDMHFEEQAIWLKRLYYKYQARRLVIDGNGVGLGLLDYMIKPQIDDKTGEDFPDFGIYNDPDAYYRQYRTPNTELDAIYVMKAHAPENTEAHSNVLAQLSTGKLKLLITEREAREKLKSTNRGQNMTPEERDAYLMPFTLTTILETEMLNLREENEGVNIILKQSNKGVGKDKFSALEYGLYYIKFEEDNKKKKKKKFNIKEWKLMN